jgi:DnaJ-class molecular chaperone
MTQDWLNPNSANVCRTCCGDGVIGTNSEEGPEKCADCDGTGVEGHGSCPGCAGQGGAHDGPFFIDCQTCEGTGRAPQTQTA